MDICQIDQLKNIIQSSHINFLFGSGLSCPFLSTLNMIEVFLTEAQGLKGRVKDIVEASLNAEYFTSVMEPCLSPQKDDDNYNSVVGNYKNFLSTWNAIMAHRQSSILDKTINIFTTNIDNLVETAAESLKIEFNDGFQGHLHPVYREDSFNNVLNKISPLYQNVAQIPIVNYIKIHGSINWKEESQDSGILTYDAPLSLIKASSDAIRKIPNGQLIKITRNMAFDDIVQAAKKLADKNGFEVSKETKEFLKVYNHLIMIRPRKAKFRESVVDSYFYELMRRYSNSLEQANTSLLVSGFSFADEHIAKITLRAANTNPTLQILIFAYCEDDVESIWQNLNKAGMAINHNIRVISPKEFYKSQTEAMREWLDLNGFRKQKENVNASEIQEKVSGDVFESFSLQCLNKYIFRKLLSCIG